MVHRQFPAVPRAVRGTTLGKVSSYTLQPIGFIRSTLKRREDAPRQGTEGAPDAWLEIEPRFTEALLGLEAGHELIVITWLHEGEARCAEESSAQRCEASGYRCVLHALTCATQPARAASGHRA